MPVAGLCGARSEVGDAAAELGLTGLTMPAAAFSTIRFIAVASASSPNIPLDRTAG